MRNRLLSVFLISIVVVTFAACGSESVGGSDLSDGPSPASDAGTSVILNEDEIYSIDDFEAAGYKKVTHFELETLPGATDAWFGFFNQKDVEVRFYPSHQTALEIGVEPAEFAIGKGAAPWQKRPPVRFAAYAVVGNVVMLCELEVASCESLATRLD